MLSSAVLVEAKGPILIITLNRPEVRNAINFDICNGIADALRRLDEDESLRVGIITGAGPVFSSGADLRCAAAGDALALNNFVPGGFAGFVRARRRKPCIAAVQGTALAGGFEIMLACELAVAADNAFFGLPEVRIGIMAAAGGVTALGRQLPYHQAMKLLLTGKPIDAMEAYRLGLVTEIVPPGEVLSRAKELAYAIAEAAPLAVEATLHLASEARAGTPRGELERLNSVLIERLLESRDAQEGRQAFLEKRPPKWTSS